MKVTVKAASQEEFDSKREELIKSIAGSKFDVKITPKGESSPMDEKQPFYVAQSEILDEWEAEFWATIHDIKNEIAEVIGE